MNVVPNDSDDDNEVEIIATVAAPTNINIILSRETGSQGEPLPRGRGRPMQRPIKFVASPGDPFVGTASFIHFVVRGRPTPKQRPASGLNGNIYNPSANDEADFRDVAEKLCINHLSHVKTFFAKPRRITAMLKFCFADKDNLDLVDHADVDNMIKFYLDAMNELFYEDDGQVCRVVSEKDFSGQYGGNGFVVVTLKIR